MEHIEFYTSQIKELIILYGARILGAILTLVIGLWVIKWLNNAFKSFMEKRSVDSSLKPFLTSLVSMSLKIILFIAVLGMIGIEMTSFIAVLGAAGLAIGMALSGTLSNFAGGVVLLIIKPFKVGDWIESQGHSGSVHAIQIFHTILKTPDNKTVILPNGKVSTDSLVNYSTEEKRRMDYTFSISYSDDLEKAKSIIREIIEADDRILKDPEPFVRMSEMADSSVNIVSRNWLYAADFWPTKFDLGEKVYAAFKQNDISIPFPQLDVHLQTEKEK
jgi:small conductance mechanosensitive channel